MKTIVIMNIKGGCGKTATADNMAEILGGIHDKKVLLIDNDKQGNTSLNFGVFGYDQLTISDVLTGKCTFMQAIRQTEYKNVDVLPANMELLTANLKIIMNENIEQTTIFINGMKGLKEYYDYCIFDCPPDINMSVINALMAADEIIIPIKIDRYALEGMKELENQIEEIKALNPNIRFRGCLVTMFYKAGSDVCVQGEEYLTAKKYPVFNTHIRRTPKADESTFSGGTFNSYSPRCSAAVDYRKFVREYLEGVNV